MKTRLNFIAVLCLFTFSLFLGGCEKDDLSSSLLTNREAAQITYSALVVSTGDSVTVTFDAGNDADCGHIQIQMYAPDADDWVQVAGPVTPEAGIALYSFEPSIPGEYNFRAKYTRTGNPKTCSFESTGWIEAEELLLVEGDTVEVPEDTTSTDSCAAYFAAEATCDSMERVAVFTLVSPEDQDYIKIQGGLTNGVQGDATVTVTGAELEISQRRPGNSSNRIIKLEGAVTACDTVTITVMWNSSNNGTYITGEWSASLGDTELTVENLECD